MLPVDRKKRHKICKKMQIFRPFLRQLKQALAVKKTHFMYQVCQAQKREKWLPVLSSRSAKYVLR